MRNIMLLLLAALPLLAAAACGADTPPAAGAGDMAEVGAGGESLLYYDVHSHLLGGGGPQMIPGGQRSGGPGRQPGRTQRPGGSPAGGAPDYEAAARNLISQLDTQRIRKAIVMPPPRNDENVQANELADLARVVRQHPDRLALAGGGDVLNPMLHRYAPGAVTDAVRAQFTAAAEKLVREYGVCAFGEIAALHLSFFSGHVFSQVAPDHPLCLLLADLAAQHDIPVDWHMEAVPADMPVPAGFSNRNQAVLKENIAAFERLLAHNRRARIVWQHIGWDNTGGMTVALLRRLLAAHPNLYLAWKIEERELQVDRITPMPNRVVDEEWRIKPEWQALFAEFPERFVVGTDEFFGIAGVTRRMPGAFAETWRVMDQLPPDLLRQMGRDNPERLYRLGQEPAAPRVLANQTTGALLEQAKKQCRERYDAAIAAGAEIIPTPDGRSFLLLWVPPGGETAPPVIATISGHGSWAFDEFAVWREAAARHGFAVLALQWWLGGGEEQQDYYAPGEMYPIFTKVLGERGFQPGRVLFHGFSRGAANSYGMAYCDRQNRAPWFALMLANAGGYHADYPLYRQLAETQADTLVAGSRWALFCGEPDPKLDGYTAMSRSADWIRAQGGRVELFINDPEAGHGGFHRNPRHVEAVLALFAKILREHP